MPKDVHSFRLDSETLDTIRKLSRSWGVSQAQVIEILVREAEGRELKTVKETQ